MTAAHPSGEHIDHADHPTHEPEVRDRRRPGRLPHVSPALVDLLRSKPKIGDPDNDNRHPVGAMAAILFWAIVGLALWVGLFSSIRALLR